jgi:hypothetical protein
MDVARGVIQRRHTTATAEVGWIESGSRRGFAPLARPEDNM